jgi:hypothetical protein
MITLHLTPEQGKELLLVLREYLSDLRGEISDTDSSFFKEHLREEKKVLLAILEKLEADNAPA